MCLPEIDRAPLFFACSQPSSVKSSSNLKVSSKVVNIERKKSMLYYLIYIMSEYRILTFTACFHLRTQVFVTWIKQFCDANEAVIKAN